MTNKWKPTHAYRAVNSTGWAATDKNGVTRMITAEEAAEMTQTPSYDELADNYHLKK